jgi:hypothetical protein
MISNEVTRSSRTTKYDKFTITEHFGIEDINLLILEPLVIYLNKEYGRTIVKIRDEYLDEVNQMEKRLRQQNPNFPY